jgi:hypothetical protein
LKENLKINLKIYKSLNNIIKNWDHIKIDTAKKRIEVVTKGVSKKAS